MGPVPLNVKAPEGYFRVVGYHGDSGWIIGDRTSLKSAEDLAERERCAGYCIEIYDEEGKMRSRR